MTDIKFEYGWFDYDHKDGREIRADIPRSDYVYSTGYNNATRELFDNLCLPFPRENEVYRGSFQDLLAVDSHGLVVRVGNNIVEEQINPFISQPIAWMRDYFVTVAVYPGVPYFDKVKTSMKTTDFVSDMMSSTSFCYNETTSTNFGLVRLYDEKDEFENRLVIVDVDSEHFKTLPMFNKEVSAAKQKTKDTYETHLEALGNKADAMAATIYELSNTKPKSAKQIAVFDQHQPLRKLFSEACAYGRGGNPDKSMMRDLWNLCAEISQEGRNMECKTQYKTPSGAYAPRHISVNNLKLHASWR